MKIVSKYKDGDRVCFMVSDEDGIVVPVSDRSLYTEYYMQNLINSGYKYLDYHGNILMPDNVSINELVESPCTLTMEEMSQAYFEEDEVLSEEAATKYFTRDIEIEEIELRKPNVRIKTREEFLDYLRTYNKKLKLGVNVDDDVFPINYFVAPEALFTIEELQQDTVARAFMEIIEKRRIIKSYSAFEKLIDFLKGEGLLSDNYVAADIKRAYAAWGICGIRAKVIEKQDRMNVSVNIFDDSYQDADNSTKGLLEKPIIGLLDKEGRILYKGGIADIINEPEFAVLPVRPTNEQQYWELIHSKNKWVTEWQPISCIMRLYKDRTYMRLMTDSCVEYKAKMDCDRLIIRDSREVLLSQRYLCLTLYNGSSVGIEAVSSKEDFRSYTICLAKAKSIVNSRTIVPSIKSSYEMFLDQGLCPSSVIRYAARLVSETASEGDIDYYDASKIYEEGPSESCIKKYNPDNMEYKTLDELIDIMCATRDSMEADGEQLSLNESLLAGSMNEIYERPVDKLEFVKNVKEGYVNVGEYETGIEEDGLVNYEEFIDFLLTLAQAVMKQQNPTATDLLNVINNIEQTSDYVDLTRVFRERKEAYRGAIEDKAVLNGRRAEESILAVLVTRVFRECAAIPAEKQRHYGFQCMVLDLTNRKKNKMAAIQNEIVEAVKNAVEEQRDIANHLKKAIRYEAASIALDSIFRLAISNIEVEVMEDSIGWVYNYVVDDTIIPLKLKLSKDSYNIVTDSSNYEFNKFCSLTKWCDNEMRGQYFKMYCVNANITPWRVTPKRGYHIKSYNFIVNYLDDDKLKRFYTDKFFESIMEAKERVTSLEKFGRNEIYDLEWDDLGIKYTELDEVDNLLDPDINENVDEYYYRYREHFIHAIDGGKYLERARLKSDVTYKNYADIDSDDFVASDEDIYREIEGNRPNASLYWKDSRVLMLGETKQVKLETAGNVVKELSLDKQEFSDLIRWKEVLFNEYRPTAVIAVYGTNMVCVSSTGDSKYNLSTISKEECDKLVEEGILYKLGAREYYIKSGNGDYKLEVR